MDPRDLDALQKFPNAENFTTALLAPAESTLYLYRRYPVFDDFSETLCLERFRLSDQELRISVSSTLKGLGIYADVRGQSTLEQMAFAFSQAGAPADYLASPINRFCDVVSWFFTDLSFFSQMGLGGLVGGAILIANDKIPAISRFPYLARGADWAFLSLMGVGLALGLTSIARGFVDSLHGGIDTDRPDLLEKGAERILAGVGDTLLAGTLLFFARGLPHLLRQRPGIQVLKNVARITCALDDPYFALNIFRNGTAV